MSSISIDIEKLDEMFEHYIETKCKVINSSHGSQSEMWFSGECEEAERWLKLFGVDVSYEVVQPLIDKMMKERG